MLERIKIIFKRFRDGTRVANEYKPGFSNIGPYEKEQSLRWLLMGLIITFSLPFLGYVFAFHWSLKLLTFFPAFFTAIKIFEYALNFSVLYGLSGKHNFNELRKSENVLSPSDKSKDSSLATDIIISAYAISMVFTLISLLF